jgi:hypothetical protein
MAERTSWSYISIGLLVLVIILGSLTGYYYLLYNDTLDKYNKLLQEIQSPKTKISVALLIDFSNGTKIWYNRTVNIGITLFDYTWNVTNGKVTYQQYPFGKFVTGILEKEQNKTHYWMWYFWSAGANTWVLGPVGADSYTIQDGEILMWRYEKPSF